MVIAEWRLLDKRTVPPRHRPRRGAAIVARHPSEDGAADEGGRKRGSTADEGGCRDPKALLSAHDSRNELPPCFFGGDG
jgi:hypothetical protein